ncbi:MAG: hypothetical protein ACHQ5A_03090 [Opitutales bacterium]
MNAKTLQFIRRAGLVAGTVMALSCTGLSGADKAAIPTDAFPNFDSYVKVTGQAAAITGDGAAFQSRARQSQDGAYGIEDFYYTRDMSQDTNLTMTGHALTGVDDYLAQVDWTKNDVGKFEIGYKSFRTFYDGVGGFFPAGINNNPAGDSAAALANVKYTVNKQTYSPILNNIQWAPLANEVLSLDRSKFWINGSIALPNMPVFSFSYVNELRNGRKDSTIWGDSDLTGIATIVNNTPLGGPASADRKFMPSWIQVGERHESYEATVRHTVKNVTASITAFGDKTNNLDTRYVIRYPGETKIYASPSLASSVLLSSVNANNQIQQSQTDGMATKTDGVRGNVQVDLTDKLKLVAGGIYQELTNNMVGDRTLVTATPTSLTTIPTGPASTGVSEIVTDNNQNLVGYARVKELTGNVGVEWNITKDLFAKLAYRTSQEWFTANSSYTVVAASGTPAITLASTPRVDWARLNQSANTPVLDLRWNPVSDLSLYFSGSKRSLSGTEKDTSAYNPLTAVLGTAVNNHVTEDHGDYTLGANWRTSSYLTLRVEGFQKSHQDQAVDTITSGGPYNYLLDTRYKGGKVTAIFRPSPMLALTTRYIHQTGTMQVTGYPGTTPTINSGDVKNDNITETVDFNPAKSFYVQLTVGAVYNTISTIYPNAGVTPATASAYAIDCNSIVQDSKNDYQTGTFLLGFVVGPRTDLQAQFTGYRASNGDSQLAAWTMPYGVAVRESMTTIGVKHQFNDKLRMNVKIGYVSSTNDTTGSFTNYKGPLAYLSFEHAL